MKVWTRPLVTALLFATLFLAGCPTTGPKPDMRELEVPATVRTVEDHILYAPTTWSGDVRLVRPLIITRTATLTLRPGTRILFDLPDPVPNKDREPWILVMGSLVALGSAEQPISFTSVQPRRNELDDMIQVQKAKEAHFRHCAFERGPWALHIHETAVDVFSSVFRGNYGGIRFQGDKIVIRGSRFEQNQIGVRSLRTSPVIEENTFTDNLTGIFFREGVERAVLRRNNFDNREYDVKLGEAQTAEVDASRNWWKALEAGLLAERIYDATDAEGLGRVITANPLPNPWGSEPKKK